MRRFYFHLFLILFSYTRRVQEAHNKPKQDRQPIYIGPETVQTHIQPYLWASQSLIFINHFLK